MRERRIKNNFNIFYLSTGRAVLSPLERGKNGEKKKNQASHIALVNFETPTRPTNGYDR